MPVCCTATSISAEAEMFATGQRFDTKKSQQFTRTTQRANRQGKSVSTAVGSLPIPDCARVLGRAAARGAFEIGQQPGDKADRRQEGAQPEHQLDAGEVGELAQHGGTDA